MKFSTRARYGLKAILALAARYGEGSLSVPQIAKSQGISTPYLEQILGGLKKKGLVKSVRGPQGGYILSKKPSEIDLESLFYALEGKPVSAKGAPEADEIALANGLFWKRFENSISAGLSETSLKTLIDEARSLKKSGKRSTNHTFSI